MKLSDQLIALLVVFIWGTNFVFIRYGLDELEPLSFAALRFLLVALPLVFIVPKPKASWWAISAYGLFIGVGQFGLLFWAMAGHISPGLASLIVQMQVFFTVLLSAVLLHERVSLMQLASLHICFVGLVIVIGFTDGSTTLLGVILVLLAGLSWAGGNIVVKKIGALNMIAFLAWSSLFAAPVLILLAWSVEGSASIVTGVQTLSIAGWSVLVWQVVGNTLIGYGLWNYLLHRYTAAVVTPWALLIPVFGMGASALMVGEPMPWWKLLAASLIFLGLVINVVSSYQASRVQQN